MMGWTRIRVRPPSTFTALAVEAFDVTGFRGATELVVAVRAGDANTMSAFTLSRKDMMGNIAGTILVAQDGFKLLGATDVTETGDTIIAVAMNTITSGTVSPGLMRRYVPTGTGNNGFVFNNVKFTLTAGAISIANFCFDAFIFNPQSVSSGLVADA